MLKKYKNFDRIILNKQDLIEIEKFTLSHKVEDNNILLNKGMIVFDNEYLYAQVFEVTNNTLKISIFTKSTLDISFLVDLGTHKIIKIDYVNKKHDKDFVFLASGALQHFMFIINFINQNRKYIAKKNDVGIAKNTGTKKSLSKNKYRKLTRSIYEPTPSPEEPHEKRPYSKHISGWSVRGHWRTYKSGKKVWIKPYNKGDKTKPAIYKI